MRGKAFQAGIAKSQGFAMFSLQKKREKTGRHIHPVSAVDPSQSPASGDNGHSSSYAERAI